MAKDATHRTPTSYCAPSLRSPWRAAVVFNAVRHRANSADEPVRVILQAEGGHGVVQIVNHGERLPPGFDFASGRGLGTGLELARALMPPQGAELSIGAREGYVVARLELRAPAVARRTPPNPPAGGLARNGAAA